MTLRSLLLVAGMLLGAPAFAADRVSIEIGQGRHFVSGADAVFLRYSGDHRFPNFPKQAAFYEWSIGNWDHKDDNSALALAIGNRWYLVDKLHVDFSGGVAALAHKTRITNTHQQFILRAGVGYTLGEIDVGVYQTHYSNANSIFGWGGNNAGYDFLTLQVSYTLR